MSHPPVERWTRIGAIVEQALDRPSAEWPAFLDEACGADTALRGEVERLFAGLAGPFMAHPVAPLVEAALRDADEPSSRRVGPYQLRRLLGSGGMGVVYLAERVDVGKQVALKLARSGLTSSGHVQRFLLERQVLARLAHAGIANLLDAGVTAEGVPYFAMEYVEGCPIDRYCDEQCLGVDARLRLFVEVCEAVGYAHRNLVVHRDLKPGNILVSRGSAETGSGTHVKLLDFGIAKLLTGTAGAESELTRTGFQPMTPEYAAPEQLRNEPVTTATDIYALGLLLYRLLTGSHAYSFPSQAPADVTRVVCEHLPDPPSLRVARSEGSPPGLSRERLRRRLRGDLDVIVMMALRKEPERRYASADQLLEDVQRHLDGLPVRARRDTLRYRSSKFVRRHRMGLAVAALVLLGLVASLYRERALRLQAETESAKANQIAAFLVDLFKTPDPNVALGDTLTARMLADRGAERVRAELVGQPAVQATMMEVLGQVYQNLGSYEEASTLLEDALAVRSRLLGDHHVDVAASVASLGRLRRDQGYYAAAESLHHRALDLRRRLLGPSHHEVGASLDDLAYVLEAKGDFPAAESLYRAALAIRREALGPVHTEVAQSLNNLAGAILRGRAEYGEAEQLVREALRIQRIVLPGDHPEIAVLLNNLGQILNKKKEYEAAEPFLREAADRQRRLYGNEHPYLAVTLNNLAIVLKYQKKFKEAEPFYLEALAIRRKSLGPDHPDVAISLNNLAGLYQAKGEYERAEPIFREAIASLQRQLGAEHEAVSYPFFALGGVMIASGSVEEGLRLHREALRIRRKAYSDSHPRVREVLNVMGRTLTVAHRFEEAEEVLLQSYEAAPRDGEALDYQAREAIQFLIDLYTAWERPEKAAGFRQLLPPA